MDTNNDRKHALSRRALLRHVATFGGVALLAACGSTATSPAADTSATASSGAASTNATTASSGAAATSAATTSATASSAAATSAPAAQTTQATKLRVLGVSLDETRSKARLDSFTKANPNITIESAGDKIDNQQLLTAIASGDPPDVISVDRFTIGSWAGRNAIDPLDDLISRDGFDFNQFYPFLKDQVSYDSKVYGVPQFVNMDLIYWNGDVLKEVGVDPASIDTGKWEQLQQLGGQLHKLNGSAIARTGFDTKMQDSRLWLWSWANGAEPISADGMKANFADPKVVEALTWAKATVDAQGGEKARAAFQQTQNFFSPQNPILIGQIAGTVYEQWLIGVLKVNPQANFVTMTPRKRNSQEPLTDATGLAFAIPRGIQGDRREAAWTFIKGMTSTDAWLAGEHATQAENKTKNEPYTPTITGNIKADDEVRNSIYQSIGPAYDATVKLLPDALKAAKFRYSGPVAAQIAEQTTASVNDALQGVKSPQDAMTELQQKAQQLIDDFKNGVR